MLSDLRAHERQVYSQNGEDGTLAQIFACIGTTNRTFVEFGAWDGLHLSNTAHLRIDHGWSGLLMEGDPERRSEIVETEFVTAENIDALLSRYAIPEQFDLLSIDIDGNDYWVWKALTRHQPRVVVIEYNIFFGVGVSKTVPYHATRVWDHSTYCGASLAALEKLGREKGYTLVHTDSYAPNAFFILDRELPDDYEVLAIEQLAAWQWDRNAEPLTPADRPWKSV